MDEGKLLAGIAVGILIGIIVIPKITASIKARKLKILNAPTPPAAVNCETWEWVDWKGRPRQITIHREVR